MEEVEQEFSTEVGLKKTTLETSQNSSPSVCTPEILWEMEREKLLKQAETWSKLAPKFEGMQFGEDSSLSIDELVTLTNMMENLSRAIKAVVNRAVKAAVNHEDYEGKDQSEEIDLSGMHEKKQKRQMKKASPEWLLAQKQPFHEFARSFLTAEVRARIETEKALAKRKGLPLLRFALGWNTSNRIRVIAFHLFDLQFPKSCSKEDLISRLLTSIVEITSPFPEEIANEVADIGIVHKPDEGLERGEIVYLRANATSNAGEACVAACETLVGWVVRNKNFVAFSVIPITSIYWGRLVEERRELTMF